jgi:hypothetical protein
VLTAHKNWPKKFVLELSDSSIPMTLMLHPKHQSSCRQFHLIECRDLPIKAGPIMV